MTGPNATRKGRVLLTGASGGIGCAIAQQLAADGWPLLLVGRTEAALVQLQQRLPGAAGRHAIAAVDIATADGRAQLLRRCAELGDVAVLVNNAGSSGFALLPQLGDERLRALFDINVLAPIALCRELLPKLMQRADAQIINIGSTFGALGYPGFSGYSATKFALRGFTQALRRELADSAVRVHYLAPRAVNTTLNSRAVCDLNRALGNRVDAPAVVARAVARLLRHRRGSERHLGWPEKLFVRINALFPFAVDGALRRQLSLIKRFAHQGE